MSPNYSSLVVVLAISLLDTYAVASDVTSKKSCSDLAPILKDLNTTKYPFAGAGPWIVRVTGVTPDEIDSSTRTSMEFDPEAFSVEQISTLEFRVSVSNPSALIDADGDIETVRCSATITSGGGREASVYGVGEGECRLFVHFEPTGQPNVRRPLETLNSQGRIRLEIEPPGGAEIAGIQGTEVLIDRKMGDNSPVKVRLFLLKNGKEVDHGTAKVPYCGAPEGEADTPKESPDRAAPTLKPAASITPERAARVLREIPDSNSAPRTGIKCAKVGRPGDYVYKAPTRAGERLREPNLARGVTPKASAVHRDGAKSSQGYEMFDFSVWLEGLQGESMEDLSHVDYWWCWQNFKNPKTSTNAPDQYRVGYYGWGCLHEVTIDLVFDDNTYERLEYNQCCDLEDFVDPEDCVDEEAVTLIRP